MSARANCSGGMLNRSPLLRCHLRDQIKEATPDPGNPGNGTFHDDPLDDIIWLTSLLSSGYIPSHILHKNPFCLDTDLLESNINKILMADRQKSQVGLSSAEMYPNVHPMMLDPTVDLTDPRQWYGSLDGKETSNVNTVGYSNKSLPKAGIYLALPPIDASVSKVGTSPGFTPYGDSPDYPITESLYSDFTDSQSIGNNSAKRILCSSLPNLNNYKRQGANSKARSEKCDPFDEFFRTAKEKTLDYAHRQVKLEKHKKHLQQVMVEQKENHYLKRVPRLVPKRSTFKLPPPVKIEKFKALRLPQKPCDKEKEEKFRQDYVLNQKSSFRLAYGGAPNKNVADMAPAQQLHIHMWDRESPEGYLVSIPNKRSTNLKEIASRSAPADNPWNFGLDAKTIQPEFKYDTDTTSPDMLKEGIRAKSTKSYSSDMQGSIIYSDTRSHKNVIPNKKHTRASVVNLYLQKKETEPKHSPGVMFPNGSPKVAHSENPHIPTVNMDLRSTNGSAFTQHSQDRGQGRKVLAKYTNVNVFAENEDDAVELKENEHKCDDISATTPQANSIQNKCNNESDNVQFLKQKELSTVEVGKVKLPPIPVSRRQSSLYEKLLTQSDKQDTDTNSVPSALEKHKIYPTPATSIRCDSNLREPTSVSTRELMADIKETPREHQKETNESLPMNQADTLPMNQADTKESPRNQIHIKETVPATGVDSRDNSPGNQVNLNETTAEIQQNTKEAPKEILESTGESLDEPKPIK